MQSGDLYGDLAPLRFRRFKPEVLAPGINIVRCCSLFAFGALSHKHAALVFPLFLVLARLLLVLAQLLLGVSLLRFSPCGIEMHAFQVTLRRAFPALANAADALTASLPPTAPTVAAVASAHRPEVTSCAPHLRCRFILHTPHSFSVPTFDVRI